MTKNTVLACSICPAASSFLGCDELIEGTGDGSDLLGLKPSPSQPPGRARPRASTSSAGSEVDFRALLRRV